MNNPSAFPRSLHVGSLHVGDEIGMTLRDYFAAKAMQAIVTHNERRSSEFGYEAPYALSERAYAIADFMLKVREA